jgi:hypothetical protein
MLQVAAGATSICGSTSKLCRVESRALRRWDVGDGVPQNQITRAALTLTVGPRQYADAKRRLRLWYKTDDAFKCLWQSARYLRSAIFADWGIYSPWASFVTVVSAA